MDSDHVPALPQITRRSLNSVLSFSHRVPFAVLGAGRLATLEAVDRHSRRPSHDGRRDQNDKRLDG